MMLKGVRATAGIVIVMGLIGMLTGSWRASGTIARLVGDASGFISPAWSLTTVFIINGAVSTLLGTSFGTAATLGVISMTMTNAMGVDPLLAGGAVLAGVYVGDRCSPVSTSAALVAIVTHTSLYANIRRMFITGALPMALAVLLWIALGFLLPGHTVDIDITSVFARQFDLSIVTYVPAVTLVGALQNRHPLGHDGEYSRRRRALCVLAAYALDGGGSYTHRRLHGTGRCGRYHVKRRWSSLDGLRLPHRPHFVDVLGPF